MSDAGGPAASGLHLRVSSSAEVGRDAEAVHEQSGGARLDEVIG